MSRWPTEAPRQIDKPEPGFFKMRLVSKGPHVAAQISHQDGRWWADIDGVRQIPSHEDPMIAEGVTRIWESGERIHPDQYDHLLAMSAWAKEHDQTHPLADPKQPINVNRMKTPF